MVFHEINNISDIISGHRIIICYIKGKKRLLNNSEVDMYTELALEMLEKKNDDLLLLKFSLDSDTFQQFKELYRPEHIGPITLFAINNDGIPILSELVVELLDIPNAIENLSSACQLNPVPMKDLYKLNLSPMSDQISHEYSNRGSKEVSHVSNSKTNQSEVFAPTTKLQIRLPSGSREEKQFNRDDSLHVVWIVISTTYKIKDFDLKTYNHPIFTEQDYEKTLHDLDLCPNGVVIVVNKPSNTIGGIHEIIGYSIRKVMASPIFVFQYLQGLIFLFWRHFFPANTGSTSGRSEHRTQKSSSNISDQSTSNKKVRKYVSKNIGNNIHTFRRNDDSDDENNRYNGNSTQQK